MECILWFCWHRSFSLHSELGWVSSCVENLKLFCSFGSLRVFIPFLQCDGSILLMLSWVVWIEMLNVSYVLGFLADTTFQAMITCLKHLNKKENHLSFSNSLVKWRGGLNLLSAVLNCSRGSRFTAVKVSTNLVKTIPTVAMFEAYVPPLRAHH